MPSSPGSSPGSRSNIGGSMEKDAADKIWKQHAETLGFKTEEEMLKRLIVKNPIRRIAKKLGYSVRAINYRMKRYGIKNPRSPGGTNNVKGGVNQEFVL